MKIFEFIKALETDSTFYGMVLQISIKEDTSYKVAYEMVEQMRIAIGMRRRFKGYSTFLTMKRRYQKANGNLIFVDYKSYQKLIPMP